MIIMCISFCSSSSLNCDDENICKPTLQCNAENFNENCEVCLNVFFLCLFKFVNFVLIYSINS